MWGHSLGGTPPWPVGAVGWTGIGELSMYKIHLD